MRKVRLRLSREQQQVLRRWVGGARFVYNAAVAHVRKTGVANRSYEPGVPNSIPYLTQNFRDCVPTRSEFHFLNGSGILMWLE